MKGPGTGQEADPVGRYDPVRRHDPVPGVYVSRRHEVWAALAAVSAALLTPTHRPPPAMSIVLPVNGVSLMLLVTRICRRPPRSATNAAGMSTTASPRACRLAIGVRVR